MNEITKIILGIALFLLPIFSLIGITFYSYKSEIIFLKEQLIGKDEISKINDEIIKIQDELIKELKGIIKLDKEIELINKKEIDKLKERNEELKNILNGA